MQIPNAYRSLSTRQAASSGLQHKDYVAFQSLLNKSEEPVIEVHEPKCILRQGNYNICLADSPGRCKRVNKLIRYMYSWRGYHTDNAIVSPDKLRRALTLEASVAEMPAGTLTIGLDSKDGMLVDELYEREIRSFRTAQNKLCEISKLAIDPVYSSKELLASLFNLAYIYGRVIHRAEYFFIEVNPRHMGYYKRMLGFQQIGEARVCPRVNAPCVLMHLDLRYVDEQVSALAGSPEPAKERSLYAYFLTRHDEEKVAKTLNGHMN